MFLPGSEVPNATNEMAVMLSLRPMVQPKCEAKSPITAVRIPIMIIETQKQAQPPHISTTTTQNKK